MPLISVIPGPYCGLSLAAAASLMLHGGVIAAALTWWHGDRSPPAPAIAVDLVTPQTMPPPARVRAREAVAMPHRAPMVAAMRETVPQSALTESVTPATDRIPLPRAVLAPALSALARPQANPTETLAKPRAIQRVAGGPALAQPSQRPEVSLNLVDAVPLINGVNPAPPVAPSTTTTTVAAPTLATQHAPRFDGADLANPLPRYPYVARRRGQEGRVVLRVLVSAKGDAKSVSIHQSSGYRLLDEAALRTVRNWRFRPARRADIPVAGAVDVPVSFRLTE